MHVAPSVGLSLSVFGLVLLSLPLPSARACIIPRRTGIQKKAADAANILAKKSLAGMVKKENLCGSRPTGCGCHSTLSAALTLLSRAAS